MKFESNTTLMKILLVLGIAAALLPFAFGRPAGSQAKNDGAWADIDEQWYYYENDQLVLQEDKSGTNSYYYNPKEDAALLAFEEGSRQ